MEPVPKLLDKETPTAGLLVLRLGAEGVVGVVPAMKAVGVEVALASSERLSLAVTVTSIYKPTSLEARV